jgi:hypothetical protein
LSLSTFNIEAYECETKIVVYRFLRKKSSFAECITALDAALAKFVLSLTSEQIVPLRAIIMANNTTVMLEMERRNRAVL